MRSIGGIQFRCRQWREKFGGLNTDQVKRPKKLSKQNERLSRAVSDLALEKLALREAALGTEGARQQNVRAPPTRRACINHVRQRARGSERLAWHVLGKHRSTQRKVPRGQADEDALTADVLAIASQCGRYGYRRLDVLPQRDGWPR